MQFIKPPHMVEDFDSFLELDIPGAVMAFTHLHDWYDQYADSYEAKTIRGEIYPDATKSRYANTDNNLNFRASKNADIEAGDMVVDPDGVIYLLDWEVPPQPNNKMSRALRCNCLLSFVRKTNEQRYDDAGYVIEGPDEIIIAKEMPCNAYRYDGRPEWATNSYSPGVIPNALSLFSVQKNRHTEKLRIGDRFMWVNEWYIVIDVSYSGTDIYSRRGILKIQAKKEPGGIVYEN